jgi:hypothetical protein
MALSVVGVVEGAEVSEVASVGVLAGWAGAASDAGSGASLLHPSQRPAVSRSIIRVRGAKGVMVEAVMEMCAVE